jgi:hypothetical protein
MMRGCRTSFRDEFAAQRLAGFYVPSDQTLSAREVLF